jgi:hypothetical protein
MGICHVKELVKKATKDFRAKKYMSDFYKAKCAMYFSKEGDQCTLKIHGRNPKNAI